jgi:hypothetical protein
MSKAYEKMTVVELKKLIKERDLTVSGKKADLVACLYEDDKGTGLFFPQAFSEILTNNRWCS